MSEEPGPESESRSFVAVQSVQRDDRLPSHSAAITMSGPTNPESKRNQAEEETSIEPTECPLSMRKRLKDYIQTTTS